MFIFFFFLFLRKDGDIDRYFVFVKFWGNLNDKGNNEPVEFPVKIAFVFYFKPSIRSIFSFFFIEPENQREKMLMCLV